MRAATAVPDVDAWRHEARALLRSSVPPEQVVWTPPSGTGVLFATEAPAAGAPTEARVPRRFVELATDAIL
ncbi:MAG: uracil-DNA glycosylase, partial [Kofleriaceae bacterium]